MPSWSELSDARLRDFLDAVASDRTPGGGAVAGIAVAMSAALIEMAARTSAAEWAEAAGAAAQAASLRARVIRLSNENANAYREALGLLAAREELPSDQRDAAIGSALVQAARAPLRIAEAAADAAALGALVADRGDQSVRADAVVATLLGDAAARAAANLVEINLVMIEDDPTVKRAHRVAAEASRSVELALAARQ